MLSSAVWLHTDQTYPHISGAEQISFDSQVVVEKQGSDAPSKCCSSALGIEF
jgi:hypothetical protein